MKDTVNKDMQKYLTYKSVFPDSTNGAGIIKEHEEETFLRMKRMWEEMNPSCIPGKV